MLRLDPIEVGLTAGDQTTRDPSQSRLVEDLKPFLDGVRRRVMASLPSEAMATILDATERLVRSGIAQRAVPVGEKAPPFELEDAQRGTIALEALLIRGPVVLTFFRGFW